VGCRLHFKGQGVLCCELYDRGLCVIAVRHWPAGYCLQNYYPFVYVLPTGDMFILIDRRSRMMTQEGGCSAVCTRKPVCMLYQQETAVGSYRLL
jgi:hypothetical protein